MIQYVQYLLKNNLRYFNSRTVGAVGNVGTVGNNRGCDSKDYSGA